MIVVIGAAMAVAACSATGTVAAPDEAEAVDSVQLQFRPVIDAVPIQSPAGPAPTEATATSLDQVWEKVGDDAAELAPTLTTVPQSDTDLAVLAPFAELAAAEVALLPAQVRLYVPTIGCDQLLPGAEYFEPTVETVACDIEDGTPVEKLHLGPTELDGTHVSSAEVAPSQAEPNHHVVTVYFTDEGASSFADLTTEYLNQRVAVVLATEVVMAPMIMSTINNGIVEISGTFSKDEAVALARVINAATG